MIEPPANWETERLLLRPPTRADAPLAFASYTSDPEVPRYMIWRPHQSFAETEEFMRRCEDAWETRTAFSWSLSPERERFAARLPVLRGGQASS
jgi:RimJ/RimL family protein N-acetyltransferase